MGIFQGSITYSKFLVHGDMPENFVSGFVRRIRNRAFVPLVPDDEADRRWGWCSASDPFDLDLDHEKIFFNSYLNLGLRLDRWALPAPIFKAQFAAAQRTVLEKKGKERLSRKEKDDIKVLVVRKLRRQVLPAMKVIDFSWNLENRTVRFWSRSKKMIELMDEFFEKTFGLKLVPQGAYVVALRESLSEKDLTRLETVEPAAFHAEEE